MTHPRLLLTLRTLRDVPGVLGSFVWRRDGLVIASDVPASHTPGTLAAVAVRLQRLCESLVNLGEPFHGVSLSYPEHELQVCGVQWATLAVLLSGHTNRSVLQLVLEPCLQELLQLGAAMGAAGSAGPLRPRASVPPAPARRDESRVSGVHQRLRELPAAPEQTVRSYRGQRIGE